MSGGDREPDQDGLAAHIPVGKRNLRGQVSAIRDFKLIANVGKGTGSKPGSADNGDEVGCLASIQGARPEEVQGQGAVQVDNRSML